MSFKWFFCLMAVVLAGTVLFFSACESGSEDVLNEELPAAVDVNGTWAFSVPGGQVVMNLNQSGNTVSGTLIDPTGAQWDMIGAVADNEFSFTVTDEAATQIAGTATVAGNVMTGTVTMDEGSFGFTANRQ